MAENTTAPSIESLRQLIDASEVLSEAEKKYWTELLPTMSQPQQEQLQSILKTEKDDLQGIEAKYDQAIGDVSKKYLSRFNTEKARATRLQRKEDEKVEAEQTEATAEELLRSW